MKDGRNSRYVRFLTQQGIGYGCFVIDWSREGSKLTYRIGASYCNPKDEFSKPLAQKIAQGRVIKNFQFGSIVSDYSGFLTEADFNNILNEVFYRQESAIIPTWARKAFNRGKYRFSLRDVGTKMMLIKPAGQVPRVRVISNGKIIGE